MRYILTTQIKNSICIIYNNINFIGSDNKPQHHGHNSRASVSKKGPISTVSISTVLKLITN